MNNQFPFVVVPVELQKVVGNPLPNTRIYRKEGPDSEASYWADALHEVFNRLVSPGGVAMYAPVSRAAVHKRIQEGRLTAFFYYVTTPKRNWFGKTVVKRELHYAFIPVVECHAWKKELEERALSQGLVTQAQLDDEKPQWADWFVRWKGKLGKSKPSRKA